MSQQGPHYNSYASTQGDAVPPQYDYSGGPNETSYGKSYYYGDPYQQPPPPPPPPPEPPIDLEVGAPEELDEMILSDKVAASIRHGFVRKVYGILIVQLVFTFGVGLTFNLVPVLAEWLRTDGWWMMIIGAVLSIAGFYALACVPGLARKVPWNYIILAVMTVGFTIMIANAGAWAKTWAFALAMGITLAVVVVLTLFAWQTRFDFTGMGPYLVVAVLVLMMFGLIAGIVRSNVMHIIYASIGALIMSMYLVYDTQVIIGGKHRKHQFSIDDYIFGAVSLYIDIVNLFLFILSLVNHAG